MGATSAIVEDKTHSIELIQPRPASTAHGGGQALVIYGSRFGNTERIAQALARGLRTNSALDVECTGIDAFTIGQLRSSDFVAIGGPTEAFSASGPMKEFLSTLGEAELRGKKVFAFDTRYPSRMSGSAAKYIERRLTDRGAIVLRPRKSAFVRGMRKEERTATRGVYTPSWVKRLETEGPEPKRASEREPQAPGPDLLLTGAEVEFERLGAELAGALAQSKA